METAREIAAKNPLAVTGSKVMINYARDHTIKDALDYIALWQTGMFARGHMAEAFKAQQEKRAPQFFGALGEIYAARAFAAGDAPSFADTLAYEAIAWCARRNDASRHLLERSAPLQGFLARFAAVPEIDAFRKRQAAARQADDSI